MKHAGITHATAQARRAEILTAFSSGSSADFIAAKYGVSARYVLMLAKAAGLSRPRGRPATLSQRTSISEWCAPPKTDMRRGGYALQTTERSAML